MRPPTFIKRKKQLLSGRTDERTDEHRTDLGDFNFDTSNVRALRAIIIMTANTAGKYFVGPHFCYDGIQPSPLGSELILYCG